LQVLNQQMGVGGIARRLPRRFQYQPRGHTLNSPEGKQQTAGQRDRKEREELMLQVPLAKQSKQEPSHPSAPEIIERSIPAVYASCTPPSSKRERSSQPATLLTDISLRPVAEPCRLHNRYNPIANGSLETVAICFASAGSVATVLLPNGFRSLRFWA
jgi:hypothetical protein